MILIFCAFLVVSSSNTTLIPRKETIVDFCFLLTISAGSLCSCQTNLFLILMTYSSLLVLMPALASHGCLSHFQTSSFSSNPREFVITHSPAIFVIRVLTARLLNLSSLRIAQISTYEKYIMTVLILKKRLWLV